MAKTYKITGKRFLRLYEAKARTASYSAVADAYTISTSLCDVPWSETKERVALFPFHAGKEASDEANVNNREMFDAAMFCAEHDAENGMHRAYAQAACYRFTVPDATAHLEEIAASVSSDPYTPDGARIAVFTSDDPEVPMLCSTCRTGGQSTNPSVVATDEDGDGVLDTWTSDGRYADHVAPRRTVSSPSGDTWYVGTGRAVLRPTGGIVLKKYLFLFVLLENYNTSRSGYLEGSSYIAPKVELTLTNPIAEWDSQIADGKTEIDCASDPFALDFPVLRGGVPPTVDPSSCLPTHFRDNVSEVPFSDDCLPSPEIVKQYTPPSEYSLTVMEEGGGTFYGGTYPWHAASLFVDDPAGMRTDGFSGGAKQEVGPRQLVYKIRDLFAITYMLSRFPLFNHTAYNLIMARRNYSNPSEPMFPCLVQPGGGMGGHGDFMFGDEVCDDYYLPPPMGETAMPYSITGSKWVTEGNPVNLYSPFCEYTHKGALALGGRLSSIHCLYNKGDTDSPLGDIAPGVRILVASFSEGSVTHGDKSEYFEFIDSPAVYGVDAIKDTAAYGMLSGETATDVFIGDPLGPDESSLDVANHDDFMRDSVASPFAANVPNTSAVMLKDLLDECDTYRGIAYDLDHNDGKPFDAWPFVKYAEEYPHLEIYDGGFLPDSTAVVHVLFGPPASSYWADEFIDRKYFDSGSGVVKGTTVRVSADVINALHDPAVYRMHIVNNGGTYGLHSVSRRLETGFHYDLWQYSKQGQLVAHFVNGNIYSPSPDPTSAASTFSQHCRTGAPLLASTVYPIFVTDGEHTKLLAFLRLVTRESLDLVAYPKSSDENKDAYSLSTVSFGEHHNATLCFFKWFTATYAQIWAPGDGADTDYGPCNMLRYPNMLNQKSKADRFDYDEDEGTITPRVSLGPTIDPVSWGNTSSDGTCHITYAGETLTGHGKIFGVCKVPVKYDAYVYLFGAFTDMGGVPCKNVVRVYFTEDGPVAQQLTWDQLITPSNGDENTEDSETDPIYFELAPEAVCGTGPEFSSRLVMYGNFTNVGSTPAPNGIVVVDPADSTITALSDPMRIGFQDKSHLMNADSTSGICAYLNNNGNLAPVRDVTVYPEELPWSRTVKSDSGILGVRNCYAKFYEGNVTTSPAYLTYSTGPVFLIGHVKKFARKWESTANGQEIVPGHVPVWRILCSPMCIPFSLPAGTKCSRVNIDWTSVVMSADSGSTDADIVSPGAQESSDSESEIQGYEYPLGYDASPYNRASTVRYAACTKGTVYHVWVNQRSRFVTVPDEVSRNPAFYDGSVKEIGDWYLVGTIDPYSDVRSVTFDIREFEGLVGTVAITAWVPPDVVDLAALSRGYIGSGTASETSMLHNIPTVGYGWVPDITFLR